jgi:uncharacterized protein (TIGR04255 family)
MSRMWRDSSLELMAFAKGTRLSYEEKFGPLPQYRKPPVVETALAVEFAPLPGWSLLNYGTMWEEFRKEYPNSEVHPLQIPFGTPLMVNPADPPVRCFFTNSEGSQLVQSRSGAFVKNWRARPGNEEYPRYSTIRPSFTRDLEIFRAYLSRNGFPPLEIWKCEVTYINHLFQGREWTDAASVASLFPHIGPILKEGLLSSPTNVQYAAAFELPDNDGSLRIEAVPGLSHDGRPLIQLTLTAAGVPRTNASDDIMQWMDKGRYAIVKGFAEFTSEEIQTKIWERL